MPSEFAAFGQQQAKAVVGHVARPAALGIVAGVTTVNDARTTREE
jgi:hypothetical protein